MIPSTLLTDLPAYAELRALADSLKSASIQEFFSQQPNRVEQFTLEAAGLRLDFSKHLLSAAAHSKLIELAQQAGLAARATALLQGEALNNTEQRPALHSLLRAKQAPLSALRDKLEQVHSTQQRMRDWCERLNQGQHQGFSGAVITDVVNIGIGGSDLGPRLVSDALRFYHGDIACHYVANVDPADLQSTLLELSPESTLFIICSKSFRTEETLINAQVARQWVLNAGASEADLDKHFLAITSNLEAAADFGIPDQHCLPLWDWVGGRYSVWSAVGLSCAIAIGWDNFTAFLAGAERMDEHFQQAPVTQNMPMLLSLLEIWYCNFFAAENHSVLPYDQGLQRLPSFLQQLTMESNGKQVAQDGRSLPYHTAPILWGSAGSMGQHSFHQLLHQGTRLCPVDFILPLTTHTGMTEQHRFLVANGLAQSRTLLLGRSAEEAKAALLKRGLSDSEAEELAPHLAMPGNRPNTVISFEAVTPETLGALLALYEHRTFCSGQLWGINSFDQWGVELGKDIGMDILSRLEGEQKAAPLDPATEQLMLRWREAQRLD